MPEIPRPVLWCTLLVLAACTGSDGKTVDSADGELEVPKRKAPPYQVAPVTEAGSITGTVALAGAVALPGSPANGAPAAAATGCAGDVSAGDPAAVVYLADIPRGNAQPTDIARRYELSADECALSPALTIAAAGGTLNLSNALRAVHHVAFTYEGMKNPLVRVPFSHPGQLVPSEKVLKIPGLVDVQSDQAPTVRARIVVVEHPYAVQASGGSFTIDSVPPGTYTLVAVGPTGRAETKVTVRAGAATQVTLQMQ